MNYYNPNYYQNNPYNNFPQSQPTQNNQTIYGKMVDSLDVVKASEVPIGGYGIFPKADFSELYVKSWNNDGTTSIICFKPFVEKSESETIMERLEKLENEVKKLSYKKQEQRKEPRKNE